MFKYLGLFVTAFFLFVGTSHADVIYGRAVRQDRSPLEAVDVTIIKGTETVGIVETGVDGFFAVTGSDTVTVSDTLEAHFSKVGFRDTVRYLIVADSYSAAFGEQRMTKGTGTEHLLTVNIKDGVDPVPGARVRFKRIGDYPIVIYSESDGECFFDRMLSGKTYGYRVTVDGYQTLKGTKLITGDEEIDLSLTPE